MTKAEFIDAVHTAIDGSSKKETGELVQTAFDSLAAAVKADGRFSFPGFGTFTIKERAERQGRNPRTGDPITIPASKTIGFKPSAALKASL